MSTEEESIQALSHAVMAEARAEADQTLTEARQKADAIRSESERQAAAERARILANANLEAARLRSQAVAAAQLKARTLQLEQRELLLDDVFGQALHQIPAIQTRRGLHGCHHGFAERSPGTPRQQFGHCPG